MNATANEGFNILITDDDNSCRETLREIIEPQGFRTLLRRQAIDPQQIRSALQFLFIPRLRQFHVTVERFPRLRFQLYGFGFARPRQIRCRQLQHHCSQQRCRDSQTLVAPTLHLSHHPAILHPGPVLKPLIRLSFGLGSLPTFGLDASHAPTQAMNCSRVSLDALILVYLVF